MTVPPVAGVVLAAGTSARMDSGFKLLLPYGDGLLVEAPVRAALEAGLDPVVVVTGHRGDEVEGALEERVGGPATGAESSGAGPGARLRVVRNPRFAEGLSTSLARGIREVRTATDAAAAAVLVGDEPEIGAGAVREVVEAWRRRASPGPGSAAGEGPGAGARSRPPVVRTRYRDRPGHPVVFPRDVFPELERLEGDRGAGGWLERHAGRVEEVTLQTSAPTDVDTDDDYREVADRGLSGRP